MKALNCIVKWCFKHGIAEDRFFFVCFLLPHKLSGKNITQPPLLLEIYF